MRGAKLLGILVAALAAVGVAAVASAPGIAAGALLHPVRRPVTATPPLGCADVEFSGEGVTLRGWSCRARVDRRGTIIFLHGVADNRSSVAGVVDRFAAAGFDIVAYDSRAHGESGGTMCTYGYYEKADLRRVIARVGEPVVLVGSSLGAAVAVLTAAEDSRIAGVVAAEVFSDLRTVVRERAPWFLSPGVFESALREAEERAQFRVDEVSPVRAADRVTVPVLLIHGAADADTPPAHSQRVFDRLGGPKRLILVENARHNQSLRSGAVWDGVMAWLAEIVAIP